MSYFEIKEISRQMKHREQMERDLPPEFVKAAREWAFERQVAPIRNYYAPGDNIGVSLPVDYLDQALAFCRPQKLDICKEKLKQAYEASGLKERDGAKEKAAA